MRRASRGYHLAEHHGSDLCMAPSQELFIAAASQVTTQIRLGPLVKLLPFHHPVRIIEDICTLDQLTDGRLEFGVGRGAVPIEHYWFSGQWEDSRERFTDILGIVQRSLANGEISSEGSRFYDFPPVPLSTKPLQERIPFWYPGQPPDRRAPRDEPDVAGQDRRGRLRAVPRRRGRSTETAKSAWTAPATGRVSATACCWRSRRPSARPATSPSAAWRA